LVIEVLDFIIPALSMIARIMCPERPINENPGGQTSISFLI
jgi:hypothetical protein